LNVTALEYYIRDPENRRRAVGILLTYVITAAVVGALILSCCWWAKKQARGIPVVPVPTTEWQQ